MTKDVVMMWNTRLTATPLLAAGLALCLGACGQPTAPSRGTIQVKGSDTMVNVAQAWAEEYSKVTPNVDVEVSGGGSGVGIAALIRGTVDVANSSREMKPAELEQARANTGEDAREFIVGYDALAVYVHKDNPIAEVSLEQLARVFGEDGDITRWSQLGVTIPGTSNDTIVRVSRQSSSGTYEFFREHVLGTGDFKLGSRDMSGSKEVVELVGHTLTAIGYSGMGYATTAVRMLPLAPAGGGPAVAPTVEATLTREYPLARSLQVYTLGEPEGEVKKYIDWILSADGQRILQESGYVPVSTALSGS
jgi:phosphate transport system substrate-binding protein